MSINLRSAAGAIIAGADEAAVGLHVIQKPIKGDHYRTAVALTMATSQAANSRLFELRNTHASRLIIPTRIRVCFLPIGTITTAYNAQLGLFRLTGFTAVDTTNTVTPTSSVKRSTMAAYPGNAAVRHNTIAGAANGMTGGTLVKDAQAMALYGTYAVTAAAGTTAVWQEMLDENFGSHPPTFAQNEGFEIENVIVGSGTSNVAVAMIDVAWAEVAAF